MLHQSACTEQMTLTWPGCGCAATAPVKARPARHRARRVVVFVIDRSPLAAVVARPSSTRRVGAASYPLRMAFDLVLFGGTGDLTWRKLMPALFQAWRHGKLPEGGRILAVARQDLERRRATAPGSRSASPRSRTRSGPSDDEFDRFAALLHYLRLDLSQPGDYARLKEWLASPVGRAAPADVVVMFLATSPDLFPVVCAQLGAAGLNGPNVRVVLEKPLGHDLASAQRDQPRRPLGVQRGAGVPHRPLPRQAGGAEPDRAALRQRPVRAALAARVHRQHPDHARRIDRRRHARRLLQPHRRAARHDPEPRAAAADDGGDGAAVAQWSPTRSATRS